MVVGSEDEAYTQLGHAAMEYLSHLLAKDQAVHIDQSSDFIQQSWGLRLRLCVLPETHHQWPDSTRWSGIYFRMWDFLTQFSQ